MKPKLLIFLAATMLVGLMARSTICQHLHKTNRDFWASVRVLPVKVLSISAERLEYSYEDRQTIELGSLVINTNSKTISPKSGQIYIVVYCDEHKVLYFMEELRPKAQPP